MHYVDFSIVIVVLLFVKVSPLYVYPRTSGVVESRQLSRNNAVNTDMGIPEASTNNDPRWKLYRLLNGYAPHLATTGITNKSKRQQWNRDYGWGGRRFGKRSLPANRGQASWSNVLRNNEAAKQDTADTNYDIVRFLREGVASDNGWNGDNEE